MGCLFKIYKNVMNAAAILAILFNATLLRRSLAKVSLHKNSPTLRLLYSYNINHDSIDICKHSFCPFSKIL